ncbi:hypothetical protein ACBI99_41940 [Nonomuraea sp. ATR24]|uniref:hypothetical protein n=1 Tax=Nonomuraea sp. ATR24 TaxID=1676744 RepID=UPI0035C0A528
MSGGTVALRPLSLVEEGDEVLVGDPETGTFVAIPAVGGVVIAALRDGASVEEAARRAEEFAGEPVDVPSFVETLRELGFLDEGERVPVATAPVQGRRWLRGVPAWVARPLFGRVAWTVYALAAVFDLTVLVLVPSLRPAPAQDAFVLDDVGLSAVLLYAFQLGLVAVHECWHWLAARSLDIPARFGLDRRMAFLVFETDLSQLWSVPRRQRYGPLLAGLAIDAVMLAVLLAGQLVVTSPLLAAWAFVLLFQIAWQCMVFLRTDLYAVLATRLGCKDLWRVKSLMLRRAFGRLSAEQEAELAAADPNDVRAGRWFRWVWLGGLLVVAVWLAYFVLPVVTGLLAWTAGEVAAGPGAWGFWWAIGCAAVALGPWLVAAALAVKERTAR